MIVEQILACVLHEAFATLRAGKLRTSYVNLLFPFYGNVAYWTFFDCVRIYRYEDDEFIRVKNQVMQFSDNAMQGVWCTYFLEHENTRTLA